MLEKSRVYLEENREERVNISNPELMSELSDWFWKIFIETNNWLKVWVTIVNFCKSWMKVILDSDNIIIWLWDCLFLNFSDVYLNLNKVLTIKFQVRWLNNIEWWYELWLIFLDDFFKTFSELRYIVNWARSLLWYLWDATLEKNLWNTIRRQCEVNMKGGVW